MTSGTAATMIHTASNAAPWCTLSTVVDVVKAPIRLETSITGTIRSRTHLQ
jgi:hypothetical protein